MKKIQNKRIVIGVSISVRKIQKKVQVGIASVVSLFRNDRKKEKRKATHPVGQASRLSRLVQSINFIDIIMMVEIEKRYNLFFFIYLIN